MSDSGFAADWPAHPRVKTWQTTRAGGISTGPYASLNLALHVGDDPKAVAGNRDKLSSAIGLPSEPRWLDQVHGHRILDFDQDHHGAADGAVTSSSGTVLVVMTADCLPILLASKSGHRIGIAHGGWRGLASGVIDSTIGSFGGDPAEIQAWLGPAIGQDAFEVGDEVRDAFVQADPASASEFKANDRGRWQADLYGLARLALDRAGVTDIYGQASCTYENADQYFSHRRQAPCGRMTSLIWLDA